MNYSRRKGKKNRTGARGERIAARWLRLRGYRIRGRNVAMRRGELDIVASRGKYLVFCEVKTRADGENIGIYGSPSVAVNREKREHLIAAAREYLALYPTKKLPRIDVIEVYLDPQTGRKKRVVQLKNAVKDDVGR